MLTNKANTILKRKEFIQFIRMILLLSIFIYVIFRVLYFTGFFVEVITCGAEKVLKKDNDEFLMSNVGYRFDNAAGRTNEKAYEGNYSVKLTPANPFGMSITFDIPPESEDMEASVWCYENKTSDDTSGYPFIVAKVGSKFWNGSHEAKEIKNGWRKLSIKFTIPSGVYQEPVVIYCWNNTKNDVYFDNMIIKRKNYLKYFRQ